ncbi:hypothetical protein, partial [Stenotrophomonas maltophilia]|uniref:hypothetical protein n=2 Tax=Stenotrophomonas maltophilia TaxID=40324 RepID=UPI001FA7832C
SFFVPACPFRRTRRAWAGATGNMLHAFSVIAHQARPCPADTFISAGWACPTAPSGVAFTPGQGWKTPEKQPPAPDFSVDGIHG